jgi:ABC-type ATPase with predicted acetyltransferase domain|tara:strand:- start:752 stop:991 length:240 start_codon:yes stop_codon:yes gene_type:complete
MTEVNEDVLAILKALTEKIEQLEQTVYNNDNLLMKSGLVVATSPSPKMNNTIGASTGIGDVSNMEWSDIHKMVEKIGGQ